MFLNAIEDVAEEIEEEYVRLLRQIEFKDELLDEFRKIIQAYDGVMDWVIQNMKHHSVAMKLVDNVLKSLETQEVQ